MLSRETYPSHCRISGICSVAQKRSVMRTEEVRLANALSEMQISTKILAQFPNNWSHGNMHGLHEISEKLRGPTLEFNSSCYQMVFHIPYTKWVKNKVLESRKLTLMNRTRK